MQAVSRGAADVAERYSAQWRHHFATNENMSHILKQQDGILGMQLSQSISSLLSVSLHKIRVHEQIARINIPYVIIHTDREDYQNQTSILVMTHTPCCCCFVPSRTI